MNKIRYQKATGGIFPPVAFSYNNFLFAHNDIVNYAIVIMSAVGFFLLLFPIHISNYVYADSYEGYASMNVCVYRYIKLFNINTVKNKPNHMMVNGKDREIDFTHVKANAFGIIKRLQVYKIIQLGDYGLLDGTNAYVALIQRFVSGVLHSALFFSGSYAKLKNYTVLNQTNSGLRYYAKVEIAINAVSIIAIILYLISEKIK